MKSSQILNALKDGNSRFTSKKPLTKSKEPASLANGQNPHTIVITCADSRVPPEMIFDQDLGDLFVIRIAGNTATEEAIGSAEYAAANLGSNVCLVLGHTSCGAVGAAVNHVKNNEKLPSNNLQAVVDPIIQPVKEALTKKLGENETVDCAIDLNVKKTISDLTIKSEILSSLCQKGDLSIYGGKYNLETGKVEFY